ncbi:hypothetical protein ATHL_02851, partial [Anaerolinea thermolimosa]
MTDSFDPNPGEHPTEDTPGRRLRRLIESGEEVEGEASEPSQAVSGEEKPAGTQPSEEGGEVEESYLPPLPFPLSEIDLSEAPTLPP